MKEETQKELIILFALIRATSNQCLMIDNEILDAIEDNTGKIRKSIKLVAD